MLTANRRFAIVNVYRLYRGWNGCSDPCALRGPGGRCDGMHSGFGCRCRTQRMYETASDWQRSKDGCGMCAMFAWPSLVGSSCSFGRNVNCDERWSDVSCCREKRMVVWIEGGCLECVRALSSGCSPNTFGLDGNDEVGEWLGGERWLDQTTRRLATTGTTSRPQPPIRALRRFNSRKARPS